MKIVPKGLYLPDALAPEERMEVLGRELFAADPAKVKERLAAEKPAAPRKRGRPRILNLEPPP